MRPAWSAQPLLGVPSGMTTPCFAVPTPQEPEFFTDDCQHDPQNCPLDKQRDYIQEVGPAGAWTRNECAMRFQRMGLAWCCPSLRSHPVRMLTLSPWLTQDRGPIN